MLGDQMQTPGREETSRQLVTSPAGRKDGVARARPGVQPGTLQSASIRPPLEQALIISGEPGNFFSLPED